MRVSSSNSDGDSSGSSVSGDEEEEASGSDSSSSSTTEIPKHKQILTEVDILVEGLLCAGFDKSHLF